MRYSQQVKAALFVTAQESRISCSGRCYICAIGWSLGCAAKVAVFTMGWACPGIGHDQNQFACFRCLFNQHIPKGVLNGRRRCPLLSLKEKALAQQQSYTNGTLVVPPLPIRPPDLVSAPSKTHIFPSDVFRHRFELAKDQISESLRQLRESYWAKGGTKRGILILFFTTRPQFVPFIWPRVLNSVYGSVHTGIEDTKFWLNHVDLRKLRSMWGISFLPIGGLEPGGLVAKGFVSHLRSRTRSSTPQTTNPSHHLGVT